MRRYNGSHRVFDQRFGIVPHGNSASSLWWWNGEIPHLNSWNEIVRRRFFCYEINSKIIKIKKSYKNNGWLIFRWNLWKTRAFCVYSVLNFSLWTRVLALSALFHCLVALLMCAGIFFHQKCHCHFDNSPYITEKHLWTTWFWLFWKISDFQST